MNFCAARDFLLSEMALAERLLLSLRLAEKSLNIEDLKVQPGDLTEDPIPIRDNWTPSQLAGVWRDWINERESLYLRAYEIVRQISSERFEELLGDLGRNLESDLLFRTSKL